MDGQGIKRQWSEDEEDVVSSVGESSSSQEDSPQENRKKRLRLIPKSVADHVTWEWTDSSTNSGSSSNKAGPSDENQPKGIKRQWSEDDVDENVASSGENHDQPEESPQKRLRVPLSDKHQLMETGTSSSGETSEEKNQSTVAKRSREEDDTADEDQETGQEGSPTKRLKPMTPTSFENQDISALADNANEPGSSGGDSANTGKRQRSQVEEEEAAASNHEEDQQGTTEERPAKRLRAMGKSGSVGARVSTRTLTTGRGDETGGSDEENSQPVEEEMLTSPRSIATDNSTPTLVPLRVIRMLPRPSLSPPETPYRRVLRSMTLQAKLWEAGPSANLRPRARVFSELAPSDPVQRRKLTRGLVGDFDDDLIEKLERERDDSTGSTDKRINLARSTMTQSEGKSRRKPTMTQSEGKSRRKPTRTMSEGKSGRKPSRKTK